MTSEPGPFRIVETSADLQTARDLGKKYSGRFQGDSRVFRAPGRVNLIGEHTDYNDGFVMPAAIGLSCWASIGPRPDQKLVLVSENFGEAHEADLDDALLRARGVWSDYPIGVAWALQRAEFGLTGANVYIRGEVPLGVGLSSSAAIELCIALGLSEMAGHRIDRISLALLCQTAENEFVGTRCGIMDQFVSALGRAGCVLFLDCRSLDYELVPVPSGIRLVICDTTVRRGLASSEYNARRADCEAGVQGLAEVLPDIHALRDVSLADLDRHRDLLTSTVYKRCRHVITENDRVMRAASALRSGLIEELGNLMAESHRSLRDDYEVSCAELDLMVELALRQKGTRGARMTGAGFGGCTINLVETAHAIEFRNSMLSAYQDAMGVRPNIYICEASDGARAVGPDDTSAVVQGST
jgi:galactokinase